MLSHAIAEYRSGHAPPARRRELLANMAAQGSAESLAALAELLVVDPPLEVQDILVALRPLFLGRPAYDVHALFPRLFDALAHPPLAAMIFDLANHVTRRGLTATHPGADRAAQWGDLFRMMTNRLRDLQRAASTSPQPDNEKLRRTFDEGFALVIALADALALIGDPAQIPVLREGLSLGHRRLHTEIAAALARLGDDDGMAALVRMTGECVARPRALAYLEELGLLDRVPEEHQTPAARAAGELAAWLAEPMHFGMGPQEIEVLESRTMHWPGYAEPIECFLLRYTYRGPGSAFSGVGITGPVTHTFTADLDDLPPDDLFALFAGWQAEHEEITSTPLELADDFGRLAAQRAIEIASSQGYDDVQPLSIGTFFGQRQVVATARRNADPGALIIADGRLHWYRQGNPRRPLGPTEAYHLHKGRELLRAFNRGE